MLALTLRLSLVELIILKASVVKLTGNYQLTIEFNRLKDGVFDPDTQLYTVPDPAGGGSFRYRVVSSEDMETWTSGPGNRSTTPNSTGGAASGP